MFDLYEPYPTLLCASCGRALSGWQGKGGPCLLFVWREGVAGPVAQRADPDCRLPEESLRSWRLDTDVEIYTSCDGCDRHADATARVVDGVWRDTVRGRHASEPTVPATVVQGHWRQCSACAEAWEEPSRCVAECPSCRAVTCLDAGSTREEAVDRRKERPR